MGEKELREKYGGKLLKAINRAIRAEVTGGNEALDRLAFGAWRWGDTLTDVGNTLFWPLVITLGVRWRPIVRRGRDSSGPPVSDSNGSDR